MPIMTRPLPTIIDGKKQSPPGRATQPGSLWEAHFQHMKVGDWFHVPKVDEVRVRYAAAKYFKGRYSLYRNVDTPKDFILQRIK